MEDTHNRSVTYNAEPHNYEPTVYANDASNWVKRLVRNEADLIQTGTGDLIGHQDHKQVVKEASLDFLRGLKERFSYCADLFNSYRGGAHLPNSVKIFNVSNTVSDFILFRGNIKLVVSNPALGIINFSFVTRTNAFKQSQIKTTKEGYDLIAQLFPFNELAWTFHGDRINADAVVKFMFTEFIKSSAQY